MDKRLQKLAGNLHKAAHEAEKCTKYQKEIDECHKTAKHLKKETDELRKKLRQITEKEKEYEAVIAKGKHQQELLDESELRYKTAEEAVQTLREYINALHKDFRIKEVEYEASLAEKRDRIYELELRLTESVSRYTTANATVEKLNKDMNELQEHFRVKEIEFQASIAEKRERIFELELRLTESVSRYTTANATVEKLNKDMNELQEHFRVKEMEFQASIAEKRERIFELEQRLKESLSRKPESKEDGERKRNNDVTEQQYPTKVAEMYEHLYDNEWTDGYENLEQLDFKENKIIETLLQILKHVMEFCQIQSEQQNNDLQRTFLLSEEKTDSKLSGVLLKHVEICKKEASSVTVKHLFEMYISKIAESTDSVDRISLKIKPYVMECINTCWLCVIHHPPLQIELESNDCGRPFNKNVYSHYTKNGNYINFIVWPALLLHKNGPVLVKGVAQGIVVTVPLRKNFFTRSKILGGLVEPVKPVEPVRKICTRSTSSSFLSR